jgi:hypothetical protein
VSGVFALVARSISAWRATRDKAGHWEDRVVLANWTLDSIP